MPQLPNPKPPLHLLSTLITTSSSLLSTSILHAFSLTHGHLSDVHVTSALIHSYSHSHLPSALSLFHHTPVNSLFSWSSLLASLARRGLVSPSLSLLRSMMKQSHIRPNRITFNGIISGFAKSDLLPEAVGVVRMMWREGLRPDRVSVCSVMAVVEDLGIGRQLHCYVVKSGVWREGVVGSGLVGFYGRCGCVGEMGRVFEEVSDVDVGCRNAFLSGHARNGFVDEAVEVFREFVRRGVELNVVSWTAVISCCSQNGRDVEALEFFVQMRVSGVEPNSVTVACILPACANVAALMRGKSVHCFVVRMDMAGDVYVGSALVDMYAKSGRVDDAQRVFDAMPVRNVVSWNAVLNGYAMHGKVNDVLELFRLMQGCKQKPDFITFGCILSACGQTGQTEKGLNYFESMQKEFGIKARMEHYACVVNMLGRVGKLENAYEMMKQMPFEPDACVWGALLSSCRLYGNVGLGEIAAEKLFELEPTSVGNYVLLSNIYAAKGMLDKVDAIREKMKNMGLRKNPGCSWIEVKNKVHVLLAGDNSHPQMKQIIERLENLGMEMQRRGFLPKTTLVLQDVEEQDKEQILCGHSEKIAVVVGLLNTKPGTPLRIIKNLRICGDCHNAIKFISSLERREIFVRDTNRFHHFKNGTCSCGDYW